MRFFLFYLSISMAFVDCGATDSEEFNDLESLKQHSMCAEHGQQEQGRNYFEKEGDPQDHLGLVQNEFFDPLLPLEDFSPAEQLRFNGESWDVEFGEDGPEQEYFNGGDIYRHSISKDHTGLHSQCFKWVQKGSGSKEKFFLIVFKPRLE